MKNFFKKTITLLYLTILLFGFFIPFNQGLAQTSNNPLAISAEKLSLKSGEDVFIIAKAYNLANKLISFKSSPSEGVTIENCTTESIGSNNTSSCQAGLKSTKEGTFKITASMNFNGVTNSNEITLIVGKDTATLVCEPPKILNTTQDACITPVSPRVTCTSPQVPSQKGDTCVTPSTDTTYTPLAPIPGLEKTIDTKNPCPFGNYLNVMIKIIIGLAAVLAMVMITMGGIEYMTSELISGKEAGKETITHAILGLVIALGAWLILNTINPQLLNVCLDKLPTATIVINSDVLNFEKTESKVINSGISYTIKPIDQSVTSFVQTELKTKGLKAIKVDTSVKPYFAYFYSTGKNTEWDNYVKIPINIGMNGTSEIGSAKSGDLKTPKGVTSITSVNISSNPNNAITVADGKYNVGAAFINIGAYASGENRGIGFHGSANNNLGTTQGCVRVSNENLIALAPYMKVGTKVIIE